MGELPPSILPPNATVFERAFERVSAKRWGDFDVDIIRRARDPWACPNHLLPYLAYQRSVDFWDENWPDWLKRAVIAAAPWDHRVKGTLAGQRRAISLAGGELIRVARPPIKMHLAPSLKVPERNHFLARYPQLRVYRYRDRGAAVNVMGLRRMLMGKSYPGFSDAALRYGPRAYLWEKGVETPLATVERFRTNEQGEAVSFIEVRRRSQSNTMFVGRLQRRLFPANTGARQRIYTVETRQDYVAQKEALHFSTVKPSLEPILHQAEQVGERGARRAFMLNDSYFGGGPRRGSFLAPSSARDRLFDRLYLFDPEIAVERRRQGTHLGAARFSIPHHRAELTVRIRSRRPTRSLGRFISGFFVKADQSRLNQLKNFMGLMKPLSTQLMLSTRTVEPVTAQQTIRAGAVVAGDNRSI